MEETNILYARYYKPVKKKKTGFSVGCEDRIFELPFDCQSSREEGEEVKRPFQSLDNPIKPFYDAIIGPLNC